jgi:hypothetical protein
MMAPVEAETAAQAEIAHFHTVNRAALRLAGVFEQNDVTVADDLFDAGDIRRKTENVNEEDRTCARRDFRGELIVVEGEVV